MISLHSQIRKIEGLRKLTKIVANHLMTLLVGLGPQIFVSISSDEKPTKMRMFLTPMICAPHICNFYWGSVLNHVIMAVSSRGWSWMHLLDILRKALKIFIPSWQWETWISSIPRKNEKPFQFKMPSIQSAPWKEDFVYHWRQTQKLRYFPEWYSMLQGVPPIIVFWIFNYIPYLY